MIETTPRWDVRVHAVDGLVVLCCRSCRRVEHCGRDRDVRDTVAAFLRRHRHPTASVHAARDPCGTGDTVPQRH